MNNSNKQKKVRVLQVTIGDGNYGGVASFLFSYYSHIDQDKVHFDFLYCGENSLSSKVNTLVLKDSEITTFHCLKANNNGIQEYKALIQKLKEFFKDNRYDIVHINTSNVYVNACVSFFASKNAICIAHSHNTKATGKYGNFIKKAFKSIVKELCRNYILKTDQYYFACSKAAGANLFGEKMLCSPKFKVIHNAIDISKYVFNPDTRMKYRNSEKIVFGYIGRLTKQKNPDFLIDVFKEIHQINKNTELWIIGEGELQGNIEKKISNLELNESTVLWGRREDIAQLMQAIDVFLLPSLYEGLSIAVIEAQASGLPVYASDSISIEHKVTDLIQFLPLKSGAKYWATKIVKDLPALGFRKDTRDEMVQAGYEINEAAMILEQLYISMCD